VTALHLSHIIDEVARPLVGDCSDDEHEHRWNQRQRSSLLGAREAGAQADDLS
jgi:hypothetical protein